MTLKTVIDHFAVRKVCDFKKSIKFEKNINDNEDRSNE